MTRLTLIGHAATDAVRAARFPEDEPADPGALAGLRPRSVSAARWLTAPERRATATAAVLGAGRTVAVDDDLRDWDVGRWRGRSLDDLRRSEASDLADWLADPSARPHGGESLHDLLGRAGRWLDRRSSDDGRIAAVTHPAFLRAAVVRALGAGPGSFWHVDVVPLCHLRLSHDGRRWVLQGLGSPTLDGAAGSRSDEQRIA